MLDCGYTSAFSAGAPKSRLDVVLKREIEAGRVPGPRLLANGPEITVTGGLGEPISPTCRTTRRRRFPGSPTGPTPSGASAGCSRARASTS
jgi:imidazolonepropionase-like amidohydrolase